VIFVVGFLMIVAFVMIADEYGDDQ
jgi:hypothetical protein